MRMRAVVTIVAICSGLFVLGGCGGDKSSKDSASSSASSVTKQTPAGTSENKVRRTRVRAQRSERTPVATEIDLFSESAKLQTSATLSRKRAAVTAASTTPVSTASVVRLIGRIESVQVPAGQPVPEPVAKELITEVQTIRTQLLQSPTLTKDQQLEIEQNAVDAVDQLQNATTSTVPGSPSQSLQQARDLMRAMELNAAGKP